MTTFGRRNSPKDWARLAMRLGLFLTDAKLWSSVSHHLRDRADDFSDAVRDTYEETSNRFSNAQSAIRGDRNWVGPVASFLGGVGLGIGVGILLAPASGEEVRSAIRDRATDMKNKAFEMKDRVGDYASGSSRFRTSATSPTGTEGA